MVSGHLRAFKWAIGIPAVQISHLKIALWLTARLRLANYQQIADDHLHGILTLWKSTLTTTKTTIKTNIKTIIKNINYQHIANDYLHSILTLWKSATESKALPSFRLILELGWYWSAFQWRCSWHEHFHWQPGPLHLKSANCRFLQLIRTASSQFQYHSSNTTDIRLESISAFKNLPAFTKILWPNN